MKPSGGKYQRPRPHLVALAVRHVMISAAPNGRAASVPAPAVVAAGYERFADFRRLVLDHDPDGRFRNAYVSRLLDAPPR